MHFTLYNPKRNSIESHLNCLFESIASLSYKYDNLTLLGDFNLCMEDSPMKTSFETYKFRNLIKEPTCFKNPENATFITDLQLTNRPLSFKNTHVIETELSDFHKMAVGVIKNFS